MYSYYYSHTFRQVLPTTRYLLCIYKYQLPYFAFTVHSVSSANFFKCYQTRHQSPCGPLTAGHLRLRTKESLRNQPPLYFILACCVTMAYDMILETATKENVNNFLRDALYSSVPAYNKTYQASSKHLHLLLGTAPKTSLEQLSRLLLLVVHFLNIFKFMDMLSFLFSLIQVISRPFSKTRSIVSRDTKRIR